MQGLGRPGMVILEKFVKCEETKLEVILSQDHPELVVLEGLKRIKNGEDIALKCGIARWKTNQLAKQFLSVCWRIREAAVGKLRIVNGHVVSACSGSGDRLAQLLAEQLDDVKAPSQTSTNIVPEQWLTRWQWRNPGQCQPKGKSTFYVVFRGRCTGIFYKWTDCMRMIRGFSDPMVRGYTTLAKAEKAMSKAGLQDLKTSNILP